MKPIKQLLDVLGIVPHNLSLFETAVIHPSFNGEANTRHHDYERLEFIGDSTINLIVADLIFNHYPMKQEGIMTKMRARLVCSDSLAKHAKKIHLDEYIVLGHGLQQQGEISNKILEDVFEAFFGAMYIDQGFSVAHEKVSSLFVDDVVNFDETLITDYKTCLQEEMQADKRGTVRYEIVETYGPAHAPIFVAEAYYNDICLGRGTASSKKEAEQRAAKDALSKKAV